MFGILFAVAFGIAAGSTLDQTQPAVHDFTAKYIVGADHSTEQPYDDKNNAHKK